ncbi:hypothetical protein [Nguyenibacter sp. L1]|uniref:hypothetical protein n=1 Tax=Nguyenibacter sp. L1 TaxID=3049350 RepID=UPI002B4743EF|nr:hypothetical protein [Nguyenibacter sp. L1]WRH86419.1 hypothetical protein QN315_10210 [Nguyenibacter sp. L1]
MPTDAQPYCHVSRPAAQYSSRAGLLCAHAHLSVPAGQEAPARAAGRRRAGRFPDTARQIAENQSQKITGDTQAKSASLAYRPAGHSPAMVITMT